MKWAFLFLLFHFFTLPGFCQSAKEAEVWVRVDAINQAIFGVKDSAALEDLVAEGVSYGHSTGSIEDKPTMIHTVMVNPEEYKNITTEKISLAYAGQTAIVRYTIKADAEKNGVASLLNLSVMQVWTKEKGKWQLFARQAVKVNPK